MADNVSITAGSGTIVATDERTIASTAVQVQRVIDQGGTAFAQNQVTIDTTAGGVTIASARETRKSILIVNRGAVNIYIGTGSVTTSNGFLLQPNDGLKLETTAEVKGITASSSSTAHYTEEYDG